MFKCSYRERWHSTLPVATSIKGSAQFTFCPTSLFANRKIQIRRRPGQWSNSRVRCNANSLSSSVKQGFALTGMSVQKDAARVAYVVSSELIHFSDLLPSNLGRSTLVHSLAYHLDLLDLSRLPKNDPSDTPSERRALSRDQLTAKLHGTTESEHNQEQSRRRAVVYEPCPATRAQMTAYHEAAFIDQLSDNAGQEDKSEQGSPRKKAKHVHTNGTLASHPDFSTPGSSHSSNKASVNNQFGLQDDCPPFEGLSDHVALVAGASITAAELVATGEADVAIAWDGGRHHAKKQSASGFCYVNDAVLAILALRKPRKVRTPAAASDETSTMPKTIVKRFDRVMYIDLDLHWGDGVEEAFYTSPNVLTLSIHHFAPGFFPCYAASTAPTEHGPPGSLTAEAGSGNKSINIPLGLGTSDVTLERIMEIAVQPLYQCWDPEVVVVQCGVDGLAEDPMNIWNLSTSAYVRAIQTVLSWRKPTVLLGGGGYKSENAARCWSLITAACLDRLSEESTRRSPPKALQTPLPLTSQENPRDQHTKDHTPTGASSSSDLARVSGNTLIPDHRHWPRYAPEYTLEVRAGEQIDQNDETHFQNIQKQIQQHIDTITAGRKSHR